MVTDYDLVVAENARLKDINAKLLNALKAARTDIEEYGAYFTQTLSTKARHVDMELARLDAVIAEACR